MLPAHRAVEQHGGIASMKVLYCVIHAVTPPARETHDGNAMLAASSAWNPAACPCGTALAWTVAASDGPGALPSARRW